MDDSPTLARKLGMTEHLSPLLRKTRQLGLAPVDLAALAVLRGCAYYDHGAPPPRVVVSRDQLPDVELAIALLHPGMPYDPQRIRLGAAMLASLDNRAEDVAWLAKTERCEPVVRAVAEAGGAFEPSNSFWVQLLARLPPGLPMRPGVMPHRTRFVAMTGVTRRGSGTVATWIRPFCRG